MIRRAVHRPRQSSRLIALRLELLESRTVLSVDALSALSSATAALTQVRPGLFASPVSLASVEARFPLIAANASADSATLNPAVGQAATSPFSPAQIRKAYGFDKLPYDGAGQTIAIIDAYDNPTIASDLATFSTRFGLPAANFVKAIPNGNSYAPESTPGGTTPAYNGGWALEIALDVEWAHAIAPLAKILLVEAASASGDALFSAVDYAVSQGANQVSMSFGGGEFNGVSAINSHFTKTSVSFFASAGDNGAEVEFPAVSPYVVGVGGTTLALDSAGNKISETTWSGSGGGTSAYVARPSYQTGFQTSTRRGVPDVAYNADPSPGIYVVNAGGYYQVGGTSAGAPQWAGLAALVNQGRAANGLASIGSGLTYGLNTALYALAGGTSYSNSRGDFVDITTGSNGNPVTTGYDTATGLGSPVADKLVPDLIAYTPATTTLAIADAGFETVAVGAGNYAYGPTGSPWTFAGQSGLSGNGSGFTSGNPSTPQGQQVAFIQSGGKISQSVANWTAGNYSISFQAAQRGNYGAPDQTLQVLIDNTLVGTIRPTSSSYAPYQTAVFAVTAGTHTITIAGTASQNDHTALIDTVSVAQSATSPTPTPSPTFGVSDAGFETVAVGAGNYAYGPTGSPWTFAGQSGLSGNGSGFTSGNPSTPQGQQVAFIQSGGKISQSVANWTAGNYSISFQAAQRGNYGARDQTLQIFIDNTLVGTIRPDGTSYTTYSTPVFTVTAGTHTITISGTASQSDHTALVDAVSINQSVTPPDPTPTFGVNDAGFETVGLSAGGYAYNPTGSPWTFAGQSGLSGNGSGFTGGNPTAPDGQQVAFIQRGGRISQSVANWTAGNYTISFQAAQRGNYGSPNQTLQIFIDETLVGTIRPVGTSYSIYLTPRFAVTDGTHIITIAGTTPADGSDWTALIDSVKINTA